MQAGSPGGRVAAQPLNNVYHGLGNDHKVGDDNGEDQQCQQQDHDKHNHKVPPSTHIGQVV